MTLTELFILLFATGTISGLFLIKRDRLFQSLAMLFMIGIFVCTSSRPAIAAPHLAALGAEDRALTKEQKALDENLRISPEGTQYTGLETVQQSSSEQPDDAEIQKAILSDVWSDVSNLTVGVTSGSVLLNGRVEDKETAQAVIEQIKQIPGVREITFSLGLSNPAEKVIAKENRRG